MILAFWIFLFLAVWFWLTGVVLTVKGGCQIGLGEEYWDNEECEFAYYKIVAPSGCFFLFLSVVLCCVLCLRG